MHSEMYTDIHYVPAAVVRSGVLSSAPEKGHRVHFTAKTDHQEMTEDTLFERERESLRVAVTMFTFNTANHVVGAHFEV